MRNWLWSVTPRPAVYLIDCDGFRVSGCAPVLPPKETGDWRDPVLLAGSTTTEMSDRFKLALAIFRILLGDQSRHIEGDSLERYFAVLSKLVLKLEDPERSLGQIVNEMMAESAGIIMQEMQSRR